MSTLEHLETTEPFGNVARTAHRARLHMGFLSPEELVAAYGETCILLDPQSTLISARATLADGVTVYPGAVVLCDEHSTVTIGPDCVLHGAAYIEARHGGVVRIDANCELGPGYAGIRANRSDSYIELGRSVRLSAGAEITGISRVGDYGQIFGQVFAQNVELGDGKGCDDQPDPDLRGPILKAGVVVRDARVPAGKVASRQDRPEELPSVRQADVNLPWTLR